MEPTLDTVESYEGLMQEPPGGENFGKLDGYSLHSAEWQASDLMMSRNFGITDEGHGGTKGNPNGAPLHPDMFVDESVLRQKVEEVLGFTYEEITSVYVDSPGSIPVVQRQLRDKIDARLLALSRSGANMTAVARILGWSISTNLAGKKNSRKMSRALDRAKRAEEQRAA